MMCVPFCCVGRPGGKYYLQNTLKCAWFISGVNTLGNQTHLKEVVQSGLVCVGSNVHSRWTSGAEPQTRVRVILLSGQNIVPFVSLASSRPGDETAAAMKPQITSAHGLCQLQPSFCVYVLFPFPKKHTGRLTFEQKTMDVP